MQTARSASVAAMLSLPASDTATTVSGPRDSHVRITPTAISPRLAISTIEISIMRFAVVRHYSGFSRNRTWLYSTSSPSSMQILCMRPMTPALTGLNNFITSMRATVVFSSTGEPTSTYGGDPGCGRL